MSITYEERTWRFGKTDELPDGPWKHEPDKVHWVDEATGLDCLIVRNPLGALCGYVGVPPQHPWHGRDYDEAPVCAVDVHGGLTYANGCDEKRPEGICHVPYPGRPGEVWWLGFDCAHLHDLTPRYLKQSIERRFQWPWTDPRVTDTYRDIEYVRSQCAQLARQIAEVQS